MSKNIFVTSDTHFSHFNIIKYESRPFKTQDEMDEYLIYKWNAKVNPNDEVYHHGDFAFASEGKIREIVRRLNGKIHLIWGNHDKAIKQSRSLQDEFVWCRDYFALNSMKVPVIMFHYPIMVWDRKHYGSIHTYGHVHSNKSDHHPMLHSLENAFNVGVDVNNFEPIALEDIINV